MPTRPSGSVTESAYGSPNCRSSARAASGWSLWLKPTIGTVVQFASPTSTGSSSRHGAHHDAQTFSSHTWPSMSSRANCFSGAWSWASRNAGAGLPTSGEGTSRGFRPRPTKRKPSSATKTASGMRKRFIASLSRLRCFADRAVARRARPVAAVGERGEAAEGHQQAAAPDPGYERLVIDADRPRALAHRLAERHVQIAPQAGRDRRFGHRHLLRVVDALLGTERPVRTAVLAHVDRALHRAIVRPLGLAHAVEPERVTADRDRVAHAHAHVALALVPPHERHAGDEDRDAEVREDHPPVGARLLREPGREGAAGVAEPPLDPAGGRGDAPEREAGPGADGGRPRAGDGGEHRRGAARAPERPPQP